MPVEVPVTNMKSSHPGLHRDVPTRRWWQLPSGRIASTFVVWSVFWVAASDFILHGVAKPNLEKVWAFETTKGLIYIVVTAGALFLYTRFREREHFAARRTSENRLRRLSESNLISICYWKPTGEITDANEAFLQLLGYRRKDLLERKLNWRSISPPEYSKSDGESLRRLLLEGRHVNYEKEFIRKDGSRVPVLVGSAMLDATNARGVSYILDMTELNAVKRQNERLEGQLRESERLESIGNLASGLAHYFNNLLNIITGYACLIDARLESNRLVHNNLDHIMDAAEKAAGLMAKLLAFGRKQILKPELLNLNSIFDEYAHIIPRMVGDNIQMKLQLEPGLCLVKADRNQLEQVIVNLVVNAKDAMPNGGELTIHTLNDEKSGSAYFSISDTGMGIPEEIKNHIFDPFFTTKPGRQGLGLGLSTVYGIVTQSGGQISIRSELGKGTSIEVILPRAVQREIEIPSQAESSSFAKMLPYRSSANGMILLAEDEPCLREIFSDLLHARGYEVLTAKNGAEAVKVAETYRGQIDLLLTDIIMPEMNGIEAAHLIKKIRFNLPIVYMTGYAEDALSMSSTLGNDVLLEKPVPPGTLFDAIEKMITRAKGTPSAKSA